MEVTLSPAQQVRIAQFATRTGVRQEDVVAEAIDRMLEYDERFLAAVERGRDESRRGELLDHEQVVARIEHLLQA